MTETGQLLLAACAEPLAGDCGRGEKKISGRAMNPGESTGRNWCWDSAGVSVRSVVPEAQLGVCNRFLGTGAWTGAVTNALTCSSGKAGGWPGGAGISPPLGRGVTGGTERWVLPCPRGAWQHCALAVEGPEHPGPCCAGAVTHCLCAMCPVSRRVKCGSSP